MSFFEAAKESVNARGMNIVHRYDTTTVHYVVVYYIANFSHRFNERLDIPSAALSLFLSLYLSLCFSLYIYISFLLFPSVLFLLCIFARLAISKRAYTNHTTTHGSTLLLLPLLSSLLSLGVVIVLPLLLLRIRRSCK